MKKFIVLDINHGGDILASIIKDRGNHVIAYDIYKTRKDKKQILNQKGIEVINSVDRDFSDYTVVYPIHCPNRFLSFFSNNEKMTHHEIVKLLFMEEKSTNALIEITGSKGKTTTSYILAYLLSFEEETYLNSSRGFEKLTKGQPELVESDKSITPGYTAYLLSQYNEGAYVLEESLGVSGIGDISILTSTNPIYEIKEGGGNSLEAKKQIFSLSEGTILIDGNDKNANYFANKCGKEVFRAWKDAFIEIPDGLEIGKDVDSLIYIDEKELYVKLSGNYLLAGYATPILFGTLSLKLLNKDLNKIPDYLSRFDGVEKKLLVSKNNGFTKITDKSGGFSEDSLRYILSILKNNYDTSFNRINLIIDICDQSHCQKINSIKLDEVVGEFNNFIDNAFCRGIQDFERFKYLRDFQELEIKKGDLIIECGK